LQVVTNHLNSLEVVEFPKKAKAYVCDSYLKM